MPTHDWTKVGQGIFHHFHNAWVQEIAEALNEGILPATYYALSEQQTGKVWPDVIALEIVDGSSTPIRPGSGQGPQAGMVTVDRRPPGTSITEKAQNVTYASLRKTIVIRHVEGHGVVALIEVLSRANKSSRAELDAFLAKAQAALKQRIHLLVVDLYPPGPLDPAGIHGELWAALGGKPFRLPKGKSLIAAGYESAEDVTVYLEPFRVGDSLPAMPLFLDIGSYVEVPLEPTYEAAFRRVPEYWREKIAE